MELELVRLQFEIRSGFRPDLDEGRQIALEAGQLEVRNFQNVVADVVQETGIMTDHNTSDVRQ